MFGRLGGGARLRGAVLLLSLLLPIACSPMAGAGRPKPEQGVFPTPTVAAPYLQVSPLTLSAHGNANQLQAYRGENSYQSYNAHYALFTILYDPAVWQLEVNSDQNGRHDLVNQQIEGCRIWLNAGPTEGYDRGKRKLGNNEWNVLEINEGIHQYSMDYTPGEYIFGVIAEDKSAAVRHASAAEQVISTFVLDPN